MLYGARGTSVTACNTLLRIQARHASSTCISRTSQGVSPSRCVSRVCGSSSFLNPLSPDCGPYLELGCSPYLHLPLPASLPGIPSFHSPFVDISLLTCVRRIAPILSGASVRRKTSCGCIRYCLIQNCAQAAYFDLFSVVFSRGFGQHPVVGFHPGQCNGALGRSTSSWCHQAVFLSHRRV